MKRSPEEVKASIAQSQAEFKALIDAHIVQMKKDHEILMQQAKKDVLWVIFLLVCLAVWMYWIEPKLMQHFFG